LHRFLPVGDALDDDAPNPFATGLLADTERCVCPPVEEAGTTRKVSDREREKLSAEIADLESLDLNQLRALWKLLYEIEAPPNLSRDWLRRAVAYRIQENLLGGLKPATRRLLERVAEDARVREPSKVLPMRKVGPNTILIREWGGTQHEVTVIENGLMFRGKRYRSLSQVARMITGSQWSGPLFFGLKAPAKEAGNGAR
jgi:Protein of unknown function (DUF2924)